MGSMIQPSQNFQFIVGDFMKIMKTLKCRFQKSFHSKYPWIEYSIKEDAPFFLLSLLGERKVYICSIVLRD